MRIGLSRGVARSVAGLATIVVLGGMSPCFPVCATPSEDSTAALKQMRDLAHQAEITSEALLNNELKLRDTDKSVTAHDREHKTAVGRYHSAEERRKTIQGRVNLIVRRNALSAPESSFGALLVSQTPTDLMNRVQVRSMLSSEMVRTVKRFDMAVNSANDSEKAARIAGDEAREARHDAQTERKRLNDTRLQLRKKIAAVQSHFKTLSVAQRREWRKIDIPEGFDPSIAFGTNIRGNRALRAAMTRIGSPYVWGAIGPGAFDCSGLMYWAYRQIGVTIPRTSEAQLAGGQQIDLKDVQPGDLIIFYSEASHVGMYAGGGKVLHAPTFGMPVQVAPMSSMPFRAVVRY